MRVLLTSLSRARTQSVTAGILLLQIEVVLKGTTLFTSHAQPNFTLPAKA